jgi:peptide/nickel transport system ATP-binding protein
MPYTEALLESRPRFEHEPHRRLAVIPGRPPNLLEPPPGCNFSPRCAYAQVRCLTEEPPLETASTGHQFACWYPVGTPAGRDALARNRAAGVTAAGTELAARQECGS